MTRRRWPLLALSAALVLGSCGDDGPKRLSKGDFLDALADVCSTAQRGFDRLEQPEDVSDYEGLADDSIDILDDAKASLARINPPASYADDFADFRDLVDDEIDRYGDLRDAAKDDDADAVDRAVGRIQSLYADQADLADSLDSEDCAPDTGADTPTSTTSPSDTTPGTAPDETETTPATTGTVETTPDGSTPTLPTLPPLTTSAATTVPPVPPVPPVTSPSTGDGTIDTDSVTDAFNAPAGYTMQDTADDIVQSVVDALEDEPALASTVDVLGVADLIDSGGIVAARIFVAFTPDDGPDMPEAWSTYFCGTGANPVTSPGGFSGVECTYDDGTSDVKYFFVLHGGKAGFSVVTVDPTLDLPGLVDAFFEANPGSG